MKKQGLKSTKNTAKETAMDINGWTLLYASSDKEEKFHKGNKNKSKEAILEYVKNNPDGWSEDGRTYILPNGLKLISKLSIKPKFDTDKLTVEWLEEAINLGLGEAISISFDSKEIPDKLTAKQKKLLKEINYSTEEVETKAILFE